MYEIHEDGTYKRARILMQARSSGTFSFSIGDVGTIRVTGTTLTVRPVRGVKSLTDPDSPSSSYRDRPLTDLEPEPYTFSMSADRMTLTDANGSVAYAREKT